MQQPDEHSVPSAPAPTAGAHPVEEPTTATGDGTVSAGGATTAASTESPIAKIHRASWGEKNGWANKFHDKVWGRFGDQHKAPHAKDAEHVHQAHGEHNEVGMEHADDPVKKTDEPTGATQGMGRRLSASIQRMANNVRSKTGDSKQKAPEPETSVH